MINSLFSYFVFDFSVPNINKVSDDDEDMVEQLFGFKVYLDDTEQFVKKMRKFLESQNFDDSRSDLESEYGIHDVSYSFPFLFGYTSYEVEPASIDELMAKWQEVFKAEDFEVSPVFSYPVIEYPETYEALENSMTPRAKELVKDIGGW